MSLLMRNKNLVIEFAFFSLFLYFLLAFLPSFQCFDVTLNFFINHDTVDFIFKALTFCIFLLCSFLLFLVCEIKLRLWHIIFLLIPFFSFITVFITNNISFSNNVDVSLFLKNVSLTTRISSLISATRFSIFAYSFIVIFPKAITKEIFRKIIFCYLLFGYFAIIYSIVFEFNEFSFAEGGYSSSVTSFFTNKNAFGIIIFITSLILLYFEYDSKFSFVFTNLLFVFNTVFSFFIYCRTTTLILIVVFAVNLLHLCSKKIGLKASMFIGVALFVVFSLLLYMFLFTNLLNNYLVVKILRQNLINLKDSVFGDTSRLVIWDTYFRNMFKSIYTIFGYGDSLSNSILEIITSTNKLQILIHKAFHNSLIQILANGGLVRLSFYFTMLFICLKNKFLHLEKDDLFIFIISFIAIFIYQNIESFQFFESDYLSFGANFFILLFVGKEKSNYNLSI